MPPRPALAVASERSVCATISLAVALSKKKLPFFAAMRRRVARGLIGSISIAIARFSARA